MIFIFLYISYIFVCVCDLIRRYDDNDDFCYYFVTLVVQIPGFKSK